LVGRGQSDGVVDESPVVLASNSDGGAVWSESEQERTTSAQRRLRPTTELDSEFGYVDGIPPVVVVEDPDRPFRDRHA